MLRCCEIGVMTDQHKRTRHEDTTTADLLHPPKQLKTSRSHSGYAHRTPGSISANPGECDFGSIRLSLPAYEFGRVFSVLPGQATPTGFVFGRRLLDGLSVIAKLSSDTLQLEREFQICRQLTSQPEGHNLIITALDIVQLPDIGLTALIVIDEGLNFLRPLDLQQKQRKNLELPNPANSAIANLLPSLDITTFFNLAIGICHCVEFIHRNRIVHGELQAIVFHWSRPTEESRLNGVDLMDFDADDHHVNGENVEQSCPLPESIGVNLHASGSRERIKLWNFGSGLKSFDNTLVKIVNWQHAIKATDRYSTNQGGTGSGPSWQEWQSTLAHMSPEQTGRTSNSPDHRTDLYSLGIIFFTLLAQRLPFEGGPMDIIHAVLNRQVPPVHEIRPDVPSIISAIINKLTSKSPDDRYSSATGLLEDLLDCQRRLSDSPDSPESIPHFQLGQRDINTLFTLPTTLFGRESEMKLIKSIIKRATDTHAQYTNGYHRIPNETSFADDAGGISSSDKIISIASLNLSSRSGIGRGQTPVSKTLASSKSPGETSIGPHAVLEKNLCEVIAISGPGGIGKSTLVYSVQTTAREKGYMAISKFDAKRQIPYGCILHCLSSILQQLLTESEYEVQHFYTELREKLGPQFVNVQLLFDFVPELKLILADMPDLPAIEKLSFVESVARFHSVNNVTMVVVVVVVVFWGKLGGFEIINKVFLDVIRSIAQRKMLTLVSASVLDIFRSWMICIMRVSRSIIRVAFGFVGLFAFRSLATRFSPPLDEPSLGLISSLLAAKIKILFIVTYRDRDILQPKISSILDSPHARVTHIKLESLSITSLANFLIATIHRDQQSVIPMAELIHQKTHGNPFYARQLILDMKRKDIIYFNWSENEWEYDLENMKQVLTFGGSDSILGEADADVDFLINLLKELALEAQEFLIWASLIGNYFLKQCGNVFSLKSIKYLMSSDEADCLDRPNASDMQISPTSQLVWSEQTHGSLHHLQGDRDRFAIGLQIVSQEGIILPSLEDDYRFLHDRYSQAAYMLANETRRYRMHLKIGQMLLEDASADVFLTADHLIKARFLISAFPQKSIYRALIIRAGDKASTAGALRIAFSYYSCCLNLLSECPWEDGMDTSYTETLKLHLNVAELAWWANDMTLARTLLREVFLHSKSPIDRSPAWRLQIKMHFQQQNYKDGLQDVFNCLHELGLPDIRQDVTQEEVDELFEQLKNEINRRGFGNLRDSPPCEDVRILSIMGVLQEACTVSYWQSSHLIDMMALRLVQSSLLHGMSSASGCGFAWLGAAAEKYGLYEFCSEIGELAIALCDKHSGHSEIARGYVFNAVFLHQWKQRHMRTGKPFHEKAYKHALSGGDKLYSASALIHIGIIDFFVGENLSDTLQQLQLSLEEVRDLNSDITALFVAIIRTILALQGKTYLEKDNIFGDDSFCEQDFIEERCRYSTNPLVSMNWYRSFKMLPLVLYGFYEEAVELGFECIKTLHCHPCHRHGRMTLFLHSIAMIACIRNSLVDEQTQKQYFVKIGLNQELISKYAVHSRINYIMWHTLVVRTHIHNYIFAEAELATLSHGASMEIAANLFDRAIDEAQQGDWIQETAFAYELAGAFYLRRGMKSVAASLLGQSETLYNHWGAWGKARHVSNKYTELFSSKNSLTRFNSNSCQTDQGITSREKASNETSTNFEADATSPQHVGETEHALFSLDIVDLWSIIKSSQVMSSDMNFDTLLEKMMEIIMENSGAEAGAIINKDPQDPQAGYTIIAYSSQSTGCITTPKLLDEDEDRIAPSVVNYVIHTKKGILIPNVEMDARFATGRWFSKTSPKSVICLPILHKSSLVGILYIQANLGVFSTRHVTVMTILCQQFGISVSNALLFKSIQKATMENLQMIEKQKHALIEARQSKEAAEKAMRLKGYFLANMSHELRTPFSGFYSTISLLSDTSLDSEQKEFVQTAQQSCEMLLKIIDDLLNFTKLEAGKASLDPIDFCVEEALVDAIDLLITLASKNRIDLSYFVEKDVPRIVKGDASKLRQILMNLIGNAIKFTHKGEVSMRCALDNTSDDCLEPDDIVLRFSVQDSGIGWYQERIPCGMSEQEIKCLFEPFSQVDGSTTRNYGGTGLGLSISLQLVKLMDGQIIVVSEVGKGSTFSFTVKCKKAKLTDHDLTLQKESDSILMCLESSRVLVAAPSPTTTAMIQHLLPSLRIDSATSVEDVIHQLLKNSSYNILVLDFPNLEDITAVVQAVERNSDLDSVKFVVLHNLLVENTRRQHSSSILVDEQRSCQAVNPRIIHLTKPIRKRKILECFANAMNITLLTPVKPEAGDATSSGFTKLELSEFKTKNILVAEDNPVAQKIVIKQLSKLGFHVECTSNGFDCLELWKQVFKFGLNRSYVCWLGTDWTCHHNYILWEQRGVGYYCLAFIDHHMPKCDGVEATKLIRSLERSMAVPEMPIIALTADIQASAKTVCMNAGMNEYEQLLYFG
ncbi:hypothetical protein BC937DRAFT_93220 [Endogone sp. FLAS-F59071]|nr:hypothetical protein BC937DRAFT_93220 [Endogone sp. FLAS-F59071]|eukprot:RUS21247.1 hypothetical protein BC937DRAFT_93220 [Endogone sp. FLAS-F59071]